MHPSQVLPYQTPSSMSLWTLLLLLVRNNVDTGRSRPQTLDSLRTARCHEALSLPFTGTEGPSQNPKKQHHSIILPPPNFTFGTIVRLEVQITPENTSSLQHTTIASYALHCAWWWKVWTQPFSHGNPFPDTLHVLSLIWRPHECGGLYVLTLQDARDLCAFKLVVQVASYPEGDREAVCMQSCVILFLWRWNTQI